MLAGCVISWRSTKQTIIASSTVNAEFTTCFEATLQVNWLRSLVTRLQIVDAIFKPLRIYCEILEIVFFYKNNKSGSKNKHFDLKHLTIKERVKEQEVSMEHTNTSFMIANPMTK